jgi:hypothetical protein
MEPRHGSISQLITPTTREEHRRALAPASPAAKDQRFAPRMPPAAQGLIFTQDGHHKGM